MKLRNSLSIPIVVLCLIATSCSSIKSTTYFKDINDDTSSNSALYTTGITIPTATYNPLLIQPDDILSIDVSIIDPSTNSVISLVSSSSTANSPSIAISSSPTAPAISSAPTAGTVTQYSTIGGNISTVQPVQGFLVDKEGNIHVPIIGALHVEGLTTSAIRDVIAKKISALYKNPVVNVRLANFKIIGLGLLGAPGMKVMYMNGERVNILDAIAAFGDIQVMGRKDNIMVIRHLPDNDKVEVGRLNLNSSNIMKSPFFYLKQGDIVYVEPRKAYSAQPDQVLQTRYTSILSIVTSIISAVVVIIALTK